MKPAVADEIKNTSAFSKYFVLVILFALPLVAYLFFLQGEHNFDTLPVLVEDVGSLDGLETLDGEILTLRDSISIITFLGNEPYNRLGYISNLNEKVYKEFHKFDTFQMISILPESGKGDIEEIVRQMSENTDTTDWHFLTGTPAEIDAFYTSLGTNIILNNNLSTDFAFIVDKKGSLRGRDDAIEGEEMVYGYDTSSVASLQNVMMDDVRVLLAEYRFAFKKNRQEKIQDEE